MSWKVIAEDNSEHTLESLKLIDVELTINNLVADVARFVFSGTPDAHFASGKYIRVAYDSTTYFLGECGTTETNKSGNSESYVVEARGFFDFFERVIYMQQTSFLPALTLWTTDCTLSGTLNSMCAAIINNALSTATGPGTLALGINDMPSTEIPALTFKDATFAEVIKKVMAYSPGAMLIFTYNGTQTIANFLPRTSASLAALALPSSVVSTSEAVIHPDKVSRVVIFYDRQYSKTDLDGVETVAGTVREATDQYPTSGGYGKDVLILTRALKGTQKIKEERYTIGAHHGVLNDYKSTYSTDYKYYLMGHLFKCSGVDLPAADWEGPTSYVPSQGYKYCHSFSTSGWERINTYLWTGSEPNYGYCYIFPTTDGGMSWGSGILLPPERFWLNYVVGIWRGTLSARYYQSSGGGAYFDINTQIYVGSGVVDGSVTGVNIDIETDDSSAENEAVPAAGAAQMLYTALQTGYHDGNYRICSAAPYSPFARKYGATNTPVQSIGYSIGTRQATIRTGPPTQLRPSDFLQLRDLNK